MELLEVLQVAVFPAGHVLAEKFLNIFCAEALHLTCTI
jgi:hypothetical protein